MFVGQKPTAANGGTVTTPTGWTLRDSLTAAGGYGTTIGADTGNTNLFVYTKDTVTGSETGTLSVTVGGNDVCWAFMVRVPVGNGTVSYGTADGQRTTTPTSPMSIALTNGTSATNFQAGDLALWAMVIPTDVTTPSQFSAESITATGATFGTAVEFNEPDSTTGNDIGGYSAYASVSSGSSTTAPTVTATLAGTLTNVRGPVVLLRVRETPPPSQSLTPSLYTNTNTFYGPTVTQSAPVTTLTQTARLNSTNAFYSATVGRGPRNLAPSRYNNTNTIYASTVSRAVWPLAPARLNNTNTFYSATVGRGTVNLLPQKLINLNVFYSPIITKGAVNLAPTRYNNTNSFYLLHVTQDALVINQHTRLDNVNSFYSATVSIGGTNLTPVRFDNASVFYAPFVAQGSYVIYQHARFDNANTFYPPNIEQGAFDLHQVERLDNANQIYSVRVSYGVRPNYYSNTNSFYAATTTATRAVYPASISSTNTFYSATASIEQFLAPPRLNNQSAFYAAHVAIDQFLIAPLVTNANAIYSATAHASYRLSPLRVSPVNAFYTPTISVGPAFIVPNLFVNQNRFYKQSIIWWDNQPSTPEIWDGIADTSATWNDLPIVEETWNKLSATEITWDSV